MSSSTPWRRRLSELGRGVGKPHAPLFAPLLYGVCAQIEALPPAEVTADPTRLGKCLAELQRAVGTASLVVAAPTAMEAEALGATVDREVWPPKVMAPASGGVVERVEFDAVWAQSEALAASLETCQRLASTQQGEPVLLAALTGPAWLLADLLGDPAHGDADWEFAGRALSSLCRQFAQSGASALLLCERALPGDTQGWTAALGTISNIARFHRIPALLTFDGAIPAQWPAATIACPGAEQAAAMDRPHGLTVSADPETWRSRVGQMGEARIVVTAREVAADTDIESLADACSHALLMQGP